MNGSITYHEYDGPAGGWAVDYVMKHEPSCIFRFGTQRHSYLFGALNADLAKRTYQNN